VEDTYEEQKGAGGIELAGFRAQHEVHTHHYSAKNKRAPEGALAAKLEV
jgi:hypothetical protein